MYGLDTNWNRYDQDLKKSRENVEQQRFQQEQALNGGIAEKRQSLLSNLANLMAQKQAAMGGDSAAAMGAARPYIDQVNALNGEIANYGRQYAGAVNVAAPTYNPVDLTDYNYDDMSSAQMGEGATAYDDSVSPYLSLLRRQRQQGY
jgi:hypothetical protein